MKVDRSEQQRVVERFLAALTGGDVQRLMDVLAPDVVVVADGALGGRIVLDGELSTVISFVLEYGQISRMYAVRNPHKLGGLDVESWLAR